MRLSGFKLNQLLIDTGITLLGLCTSERRVAERDEMASARLMAGIECQETENRCQGNEEI